MHTIALRVYNYLSILVLNISFLTRYLKLIRVFKKVLVAYPWIKLELFHESYLSGIKHMDLHFHFFINALAVSFLCNLLSENVFK